MPDIIRMILAELVHTLLVELHARDVTTSVPSIDDVRDLSQDNLRLIMNSIEHWVTLHL